MNGEIEYIADTLLVNRIAKMHYEEDKSIKTAGIMEDLASSVKSYVESNIDTSSPGALTKSVIDFLSPAVFFRINPLFGILYTIAQSMFGFSLSSVLSAISSKIIPKLTTGEQVSPDEINQAGATMISTASHNFFQDLIELEKTGQIYKMAQRQTGGPMFPSKNTPLLYKVFGFLGQSRGKNLMVGFVVWLIKTILLSAGLLAVGSGASKLLGFNGKSKEKEKEESPPAPNYPGQETPTEQTPSTHAPSTPLVGLNPTGAGQEYYANDMNSMWVVPLEGNSPQDVIASWAEEIYPQLSGYKDILLNNSAFRRTVNLISQNYKAGKDLIIPPGFSRRIDIVNQFAGNVYNDIKNRINNV